MSQPLPEPRQPLPGPLSTARAAVGSIVVGVSVEDVVGVSVEDVSSSLLLAHAASPSASTAAQQTVVSFL